MWNLCCRIQQKMKVLTFHRSGRECCKKIKKLKKKGERIEQCTSCKEVVNDVYKWDSVFLLWFFIFLFFIFVNSIVNGFES